MKGLLTLFFVFYISALSFAIFGFTSIGDSEYISDEQLKELAIRKGVISENITQDYINENFQQQNTVALWLIIDRNTKSSLIDTLKKMFREKDGVIIKNPSGYYVDEINNVLYKSIMSEDNFVITKKGLGVIFKTIAVMEGDYDDGSGRSKVEILKDFLGEERFHWYKRNYPNKLKYLEELDKQVDK